MQIYKKHANKLFKFAEHFLRWILQVKILVIKINSEKNASQ
jgi:hypothetical protein